MTNMANAVRLLFCTSQKPLSVLIRWVTGSRWSHVALVDGDEVIEAVWPRVRVARLSDVLRAYPAHTYADLPCTTPLGVLLAARSQVGKPYDWTALLGLLLRRDWQLDRRWFCSELVAWAFARMGQPLFRAAALHRVTPHHLWMLAPVPRRQQRGWVAA